MRSEWTMTGLVSSEMGVTTGPMAEPKGGAVELLLAARPLAAGTAPLDAGVSAFGAAPLGAGVSAGLGAPGFCSAAGCGSGFWPGCAEAACAPKSASEAAKRNGASATLVRLSERGAVMGTLLQRCQARTRKRGRPASRREDAVGPASEIRALAAWTAARAPRVVRGGQRGRRGDFLFLRALIVGHPPRRAQQTSRFRLSHES